MLDQRKTLCMSEAIIEGFVSYMRELDSPQGASGQMTRKGITEPPTISSPTFELLLCSSGRSGRVEPSCDTQVRMRIARQGLNTFSRGNKNLLAEFAPAELSSCCVLHLMTTFHSQVHPGALELIEPTNHVRHPTIRSFGVCRHVQQKKNKELFFRATSHSKSTKRLLDHGNASS